MSTYEEEDVVDQCCFAFLRGFDVVSFISPPSVFSILRSPIKDYPPPSPAYSVYSVQGFFK